MNVYHRLINILAESINPEYWSVYELMHYLRLAQNAFVKQTRLFRKNVRLAPKLDVTPRIDNVPVFKAGEYEIPEDCMDICSVQYNGKSLDKKGLTYLEVRYTGTSNHSEIRGEGRNIEGEGWRTETGSPEHWTYDDRSIRTFPTLTETVRIEALGEIDTGLIAVTYNDFANWDIIGVELFSEEIEGETYSKPSRFFRLNTLRYDYYNKDNQNYVKMKIVPDFDGNVFLFAVEKSAAVRADYIYVPEFEVIHPEELDRVDCVKLEIPERYHEAVACYAAYLALSKEGSKTQDIEKAAVYIKRFNDYVAEVSLTNEEVDLDPMVNLPFVL